MTYEEFNKSCTPDSIKFINGDSDKFKYSNTAEKASSFLHVLKDDEKQIEQLFKAVQECNS